MFVGIGVFVGSGVSVGNGALVGSVVLEVTGVLVGTGVFVGTGVGVLVGATYPDEGDSPMLLPDAPKTAYVTSPTLRTPNPQFLLAISPSPATQPVSKSA